MLKNPRLRTVVADMKGHPASMMLEVFFEFEEEYPMYATWEGGPFMPMPERHTATVVIPYRDLAAYGSEKMADYMTRKAWRMVSCYRPPVDDTIGIEEVKQALEKPHYRLMVNQHPSRYIRHRYAENWYMQRQAEIRLVEEMTHAMDLGIDDFLGGFATTTCAKPQPECELTLKTLREAMEYAMGTPTPCHGKAGSLTLYIGNGTDKVQKYKTKGGKMPYLSKLAKKLLDADTKALVKAGYLDSELDLTEEGAAELMDIVLLANKPAMVAAAKAKIKEAKENE